MRILKTLKSFFKFQIKSYKILLIAFHDNAEDVTTTAINAFFYLDKQDKTRL